MSLIDAMRTNDIRTENGMVTNSSSLSALLDFFFIAGAIRQADESRIIEKFSKAYNEDSTLAMKMLFWLRDIRGGIGERKVFRIITNWLANAGFQHAESLAKNIKYIPEYGRFDDLLDIFEKSNNNQLIISKIIQIINYNLVIKNVLVAKWLPRQGKIASQLRTIFNLTPKQWRKLLVSLTNVVETKMCSNKWDEIEYKSVPSVAMSRYKTAFYKHDKERIISFITKVKSGKEKINASVIYPYDIIRCLKTAKNASEKEFSNEQWKALPNYLEDSTIKMLPLIDTSGSMSSLVSGSVSALDVAVSLGLYLSERNIGPYKDAFITFSSNPELQVVEGSLSDRMDQMSSASWEMSTNINAAFNLILNAAIKAKLPESDMPTHILGISDMEFNISDSPDESAMHMITRKFENAGYKRPNIIFWNIQSRQNNVPVQYFESGTALVSGFSPSIIKSLLKGNIDPIKVMLNTINSDRYKQIIG